MELEPLIAIPIFIHDFLCIHPFNDGNGRMSRLLTTLLLYRSGFMSVNIFLLRQRQQGTRIYTTMLLPNPRPVGTKGQKMLYRLLSIFSEQFLPHTKILKIEWSLQKQNCLLLKWLKEQVRIRSGASTNRIFENFVRHSATAQSKELYANCLPRVNSNERAKEKILAILG